MSKPEPPPQNAGVCVPEKLITQLEAYQRRVDGETAENVGRLIVLVKERDEFGRAKYGQPLMSRDGRDGIEDARQELGDLLQYVFKCVLSKKTTRSELERLLKDIETAHLVIRSIIDL